MDIYTQKVEDVVNAQGNAAAMTRISSTWKGKGTGDCPTDCLQFGLGQYYRLKNFNFVFSCVRIASTGPNSLKSIFWNIRDVGGSRPFIVAFFGGRLYV